MRLEAPVVIVGAGPSGMAAALLLSRLGIASLVVERRAAPQSAPAAHVVNARTFEIFRSAGVDMKAIAAACQDPADAGQVLWVTTLAGQELGRLPYERQGDDTLAVTPTPLRNLSQHRLEPILLDELRRCSDVRVAHGHEWEGAGQDGDGVTSRIRDRERGEAYEVRSRWLIAADGAGSPVRKQLGIQPIGPDRLQSFVMIHFEANLRPLVGHRPAVLYWTTAPGATGTFVAHDIDSTWVYMQPWDPDTESAADYSHPRCADIVRRAMGTDAHPFTIRTVRTWTMTAQVAERYREGRIFLVGDAAHRFPPTGGLGLNTGVQDAHNLAWKLAAVEAGWAANALLDTYDTERRPVAQHNADVSLRNAVRLVEVFQALAGDEGLPAIRAAIANQAEHFDLLGLQLGFGYDAGAIVPADGQPGRPDSVRDYVPNALAGSRVPHAWVERDGARISTLDLFAYDRFTLVTGPAGVKWAEAAHHRVPVDCIRIGRDLDDDAGRWTRLLGIEDDGAVLVRPDQHVAWRAPRGDAASMGALAPTLERILG
ncbi:MAG TPA: FAD-dependent monooxygenase [Candidatus Eisenbacteria bacterium]|nr:FAD-dependent monooxygenase [Candidatus Eisenbacteria bacterium]